jgi:sucrose-6-phosphate hydrolase SacC (GH32 family)
MNQNSIPCLFILAALLVVPLTAADKPAYQGWQHSGSIFILTTPEGANLPASATEKDFPVVVRLDKDFFDFSQAKPHGEDIRFSAEGTPLSYQIEQWDAAGGTASIWVRIPEIRGNARQAIKMHWGKGDAGTESSGKAVFNESNGYCSVFHMNDPLIDEVGTAVATNHGATPSAGIIGQGRHFKDGQYLHCGDKIKGFPSGGGDMTTEAWIRAEREGWVVDWGHPGGAQENGLRMLSPAVIKNDCWLNGVEGKSMRSLGQWYHCVVAYRDGNMSLYVNGEQDGIATFKLNVPESVYMRIGKRHNGTDYGMQWWYGDVDEVRISKVARSADWMRMEYENQKPMQTLVGPIVRQGNTFFVPDTQLTVQEGKSVAVAAKADGALKLYWITKQAGRETIVAVDRFTFNFDAGRVMGDQKLTLQFKAVYADGVRTREIPVVIKESIQEPVFTLTAPPRWDGRGSIEMLAKIANMQEMLSQGAGDLHYTWQVSGVAVRREIAPGKLILKRAYTSGKMTVSLSLSNGTGVESIKTAVVMVDDAGLDAAEVQKPATNGTAQHALGLDGKPYTIAHPVAPTSPPAGGLTYHLFHAQYPGENAVFPADPNCAYYWKGRYHLHYIYINNGASFAHVSSTDMIHWQWHPTTLTPPRMGHGMFSGTGFYTKEGKPVMIYNGEGSGKNYIAFAEDDLLEKWSDPMPVEARVRPGQDGSKIKQGDPDCWRDGDSYYALSGGTPHALLKTTDLMNWDYVGMFMDKDLPEVEGRDISCANFFPIGTKWMLLCIAHSLGARYYLGDWKNEKFIPEEHHLMNWKGWEFFAPESLLTPDGRRVMWAWCHLRNDSENYEPPQSAIMSLPRELTLPADGILRIKPLRELESLRYDKKSVSNITVKSDSTYMLKEIAGDTIELEVVIRSGQAKQVGVEVHCDRAGGKGFPISVDPASKTLMLGYLKVPFELNTNEEVRLRIFLDRYLIEVFANERQAAVARHTYDPRNLSIAVFSKGADAVIKEVNAWKMKSTWTKR